MTVYAQNIYPERDAVRLFHLLRGEELVANENFSEGPAEAELPGTSSGTAMSLGEKLHPRLIAMPGPTGPGKKPFPRLLPLPRAFGEPIRGRTGRLLGEQKE